jgi:hypothetical protein
MAGLGLVPTRIVFPALYINILIHYQVACRLYANPSDTPSDVCLQLNLLCRQANMILE